MSLLAQRLKQNLVDKNKVKSVDTLVYPTPFDRIAQIRDIDRAFCRRHVEQNFTVRRMAKEYIQVYETILENKKKQG